MKEISYLLRACLESNCSEFADIAQSATHEHARRTGTISYSVTFTAGMGVLVDHVEATGNIRIIFLLGDINTVNAPWSYPIAIVFCAA